MIGDRIKLKRNANRESLQMVSDHLANSGYNITYVTLSNYENGKTIPTNETLKVLGEHLGVSSSFFTDTRWDNLEIFCYNVEFSTSKRDVELNSYLRVAQEQHLSLDLALNIAPAIPNIARTHVTKYDFNVIEQVAFDFRQHNGAGTLPISSICNLLESIGWYLYELPKSFGYSSISGYSSNPSNLFLAYVANDRVDELRFELLKAVGYSYFDSNDSNVLEKTVEGFARAVLLPVANLSSEIGSSRKRISYPELTILKQKYGMSRIKIAKRLHELGLMTDEDYQLTLNDLKKHGFPLVRGLPYEMLAFNEQPLKLKQKVLRARAEGVLNEMQSLQYYPFELYDLFE